MEDEMYSSTRHWRANPRLKLLTPLFLSRREKKRPQQQHAVDGRPLRLRCRMMKALEHRARSPRYVSTTL
eukprot:scaffold1065_cov128-Skeletonema_marinoi.AAC.2